MKNKPERKRITFKDFGWLWYLKEIGWALLVWLFISQVYDLLPDKINTVVALFAILLVSFWVRAAATRDTGLNKLFSGKLLRHAVIISIVVMLIAWFLVSFVFNVVGWEYL